MIHACMSSVFDVVVCIEVGVVSHPSATGRTHSEVALNAQLAIVEFCNLVRLYVGFIHVTEWVVRSSCSIHRIVVLRVRYPIVYELSTYDHRSVKTRHPVRNSLVSPL